MVKEQSRKCSDCGQHGHNSRTCPLGGKSCVKLFGVNISDNGSDGSIKKSVSMGNLQSVMEPNNINVEVHADDHGYLSDGQVLSKKGKAARERRKGQPWTEEEHKNFLIGLKKIGKGEWKTISKAYVKTRNATQVASHAQKYFLRQASSDKKYRRSSLFDMTYIESSSASQDSPSANTAAITSSPPSVLSSAMPLKNSFEAPSQANSLDRILNQFPHLRLNPSIPMPTNLQPYQGIPYVAINYQSSAYIYMPGTIGNITTCANVTAHPSGIPSPHLSSSGAFQASPAKAAEKDSLELKIGPPQSTQRTSQFYGAVRVVRQILDAI